MLNRRSMITAAFALGLITPVAAQDKLPMIASFSILGDFARQVGGDRVTVTMLVGPNGDAHVFQPAPSDAKKLAAAKVVLVNGLGFEGWIDRLVKASGTKGEIVVATSGVAPRQMEEEEGHDGHAHNAKPAHDHGETDPHAWQSVANAKIYVANVRDGLIAADPAGKATYEANAAAYTAKLDALDARVKETVAAIPEAKRRIITSHDAFGYFGAVYGIEFIAPQGVSTEAEASAKDVGRIIRQIKAEKIPAVFLENVTNPRLVERIAKESGAKVGGQIFSDALSDAGGPAGTYIAMMKHNISQIEKALAAGPA